MNKTTIQISRYLTNKEKTINSEIIFTKKWELETTTIVGDNKITYTLALKDDIITITEWTVAAPAENLTIKAEDINIKYYNTVSPEKIIAALDSVKTTKPELVKKIIPLLKSGSKEDVKKIQTLLGMKDAAVDGLFGRQTLIMLTLAKLEINKVKKNTNNSFNKKTTTKEVSENPVSKTEVKKTEVKKTAKKAEIKTENVAEIIQQKKVGLCKYAKNTRKSI